MKGAVYLIVALCIILVAGYVINYMDEKYGLPKITLPKGAHHNTIGELPVVEAMDDGDFYERDGDEDLTPQNCNARIMEECKKECIDYKEAISPLHKVLLIFDWTDRLKKALDEKEEVGEIMCPANCYLSKVKACDALQKQRIRASAVKGSHTARWLVFMEEKPNGWWNVPVNANEDIEKEFDQWQKEKYQ